MTDELNAVLEAVKAIGNRPAIPVEADLWDSAHVGAYLKRSPKHVTERYAALPGFPRAIRLPSGKKGRGDPLWPAREVMEWAEKHRDRN